MTPSDQLKHWLSGDSRHNTERDECCPDFSCCYPELLADLITKIIYCGCDEHDKQILREEFLHKLRVKKIEEEK